MLPTTHRSQNCIHLQLEQGGSINWQVQRVYGPQFDIKYNAESRVERIQPNFLRHWLLFPQALCFVKGKGKDIPVTGRGGP
jgi:hypothetical protein